MATTNYPTINITTENSNHSDVPSGDDDDSSSNDNDMDYNWKNGGSTDVEDFNSQLGDNPSDKSSSRQSSTSKLAGSGGCNWSGVQKATASKEDDVTDVEDYNDTDSEDQDRSKVYPELKLSLQEFLENALQEYVLTNDEKQKVEVKPGDFLQAQNLNGTSDYLTDCEDYNTDSEIEWGCEKSVCMDLDAAMDDPARVCIADTALPTKARQDSDDYEDVSVFSDISDAVSAMSNATGAGIRGMSEDELLEMSGNEEICQIAYSGSSLEDEEEKCVSGRCSAGPPNVPTIDVTFIQALSGTQQSPGGELQPQSVIYTSPRNSACMLSEGKSFLDVISVSEEALTDVERLDDSAAEDESYGSEDESDKPIPRAVILPVGYDSACQTDTEEVWCDDTSLSALSACDGASVSLSAVPVPHREIVVLKEDKYGDTITSVEPMDNEYRFGIYNYKDDLATDTEEYSCVEDLQAVSSINSEILGTGDLIEGEVTISNEIFKTATNKRVELHSNAESVTDVEEIYVAGTNRRKKLKARSSSTAANKSSKSKLLDVHHGREDGATDIEDMDLSECCLPPNAQIPFHNIHPQTSSALSINEKATDIEDISADEICSDAISDASSVQCMSANEAGYIDYIVNSTNVVLTLEKDVSSELDKSACQMQAANTKASEIAAQHLHNPDSFKQKKQQQHQPNTDIQVPSDFEEALSCMSAIENREPNICTCRELSDMLNESFTVVHDKNGSAFDREAEKLHIKDRRDLRDAHTDVEYVESDESAANRGN